jgi:translation elongation factor EF-Tu-like GTPase
VGIPIVMPGDSLLLTVDLIEYCPLNIGLRFVFRESHSTVGAGVITEVFPD